MNTESITTVANIIGAPAFAVLVCIALAVSAACACIYMEDYLSIDYLDSIKECQCKKVPNPFYVDGAVAGEIEKVNS